jgi:hypothetical protein
MLRDERGDRIVDSLPALVEEIIVIGTFDLERCDGRVGRSGQLCAHHKRNERVDAPVAEQNWAGDCGDFL